MDRGEYLRAPVLALSLRRGWLLEPEGFRDSLRRVLAVDEGEVPPCRRQVGVTHPLHDLARVGVANHRAAEGVAKVVEAEVLTEFRCLESASIPVLEGLDLYPRCRPPVVQKTRSSSPVKCSRRPIRARRCATSSAIGTARSLPLFGVVVSPCVQFARTWSVRRLSRCRANGEGNFKRFPVGRAGLEPATDGL